MKNIYMKNYIGFYITTYIDCNTSASSIQVADALINLKYFFIVIYILYHKPMHLMLIV